jgi:ParB-like chromosome segregation protein Spo0J
MTKPKPKSSSKEAAAAPPAPAAAPTEPPTWPAYTVERKPIAWLKPSPRNARTHSKKQVEQLRSSLKRFGWTVPCLAREDGTLIAGHGRVEAAKLEGITEAPVIVATGWSEEQCRAYALADNRIALNSGWNEDLLGLELKDLGGLGVDLGSLGFDSAELGKLLGTGDDEPAERKAQGDLNPVIQFNIVFDDERQQELWFGFVRLLKTTYPDEETLGARLTKHLEGQGTHAAA